MAALDVEAFNETRFAQRLIQIELGLADWAEPDAKRHHFIPEFMLNRFARGRTRIVQLDRSTGKPQPILPREAASRRHFYRFADDEGNESAVIEGIFGMVEDDAAPALQRLEETERLSDFDRASIATFLAYLWARTPAARKGAERIGEEIRLGMLATEISDTNSFNVRYAELAKDHEEFRGTDRERDALRSKMVRQLREGEVRSADPDGGFTTGLLIQAAHDLAMEFFGSSWRSRGSKSA